ncbi:MAG TPA: CvpA family protein [Candidatus Acidoferrales bacterium]|nr:CvpA family protein [Candidatus Acidoferrales bacterium]
MTWLDGAFLLSLVGYGVIGFFSGLIQRAIGFVALYVAFFSATNMGVQTGGIFQQQFPSLPTVDGRVYGFFGILFFILIVVEGMAIAVHDQIQISYVVLNRASGAALGVITALILAVLGTTMVQATASTATGTQADPLQISIRDTVSGSHLAVPVANLLSGPMKRIFGPVLPAEPPTYFSGG